MGECSSFGPERDSSLQFCIDLCKLNAQMVKDAYALPKINETLNCLNGACIFTSLDLKTASLSQRLQRILLCVHLYITRILYKPGPQLFIADWLSRHNHKTNRDEEIPGISVTINTI